MKIFTVKSAPRDIKMRHQLNYLIEFNKELWNSDVNVLWFSSCEQAQEYQKNFYSENGWYYSVIEYALNADELCALLNRESTYHSVPPINVMYFFHKNGLPSSKQIKIDCFI